MTPLQHKTEAETRIATLTTGPTGQFALGPTDADQLVLEAHAHLSKALGTGTHYTTADALLVDYDVARGVGKSVAELTRLARVALARAVLADR